MQAIYSIDAAVKSNFLKYHINTIEFDKSNSFLFKILDFRLFAVASVLICLIYFFLNIS